MEARDRPERRIGMLARFLPVGDGALCVEFGDGISPELNALVHQARTAIDAARLEGVIECVPSFRSLLVHYDPLRTRAAALEAQISALELDTVELAAPTRIWTIPVLYGGEHGPDLADIATETGLCESQVIARHTGTLYRVYMLGFLPGFAYLGDLPAELDLPRLSSPRLRVPAGSLAIAQRMTAIYPVDSPGGWRLIGHTPLRFFDIANSPPTLFAPGDGVRFRPVDAQEHAGISDAVRNGIYMPDCGPLV